MFCQSNDPAVVCACAQSDTHRCKCCWGWERGAWGAGFSSCERSAGRSGRHFCQVAWLTGSPSVTMWSAWLCALWSVVASLVAIFIITVIHRRSSPQVTHAGDFFQLRSTPTERFVFDKLELARFYWAVVIPGGIIDDLSFNFNLWKPLKYFLRRSHRDHVGCCFVKLVQTLALHAGKYDRTHRGSANFSQ